MNWCVGKNGGAPSGTSAALMGKNLPALFQRSCRTMQAIPACTQGHTHVYAQGTCDRELNAFSNHQARDLGISHPTAAARAEVAAIRSSISAQARPRLGEGDHFEYRHVYTRAMHMLSAVPR